MIKVQSTLRRKWLHAPQNRKPFEWWLPISSEFARDYNMRASESAQNPAFKVISTQNKHAQFMILQKIRCLQDCFEESSGCCVEWRKRIIVPLAKHIRLASSRSESLKLAFRLPRVTCSRELAISPHEKLQHYLAE